MAFSGTWKVVNRENLSAFLDAMGATAEEKTAVQNLTMVQKISQNGNDFTIEKVLPKKTVTNTFTLGKPATLTNLRGKEFEATVTLEGNKLVATKGDFIQTSEISNGQLVETISCKGVKMTRTSNKQ